MPETVFVMPAKGRKIPLEDGSGHFSADGREVELTRYVRRRLADGDLIKSKPATPAKAAAGGEPSGRKRS